MEEATDERLRVVGVDLELSAEERRALGAGFGGGAIAMSYVAHHSYDIVAASGRVGSLDFGGQAELAWMASAEGAWGLKKRQPLGWELIIESADGGHIGWYSGRHWLPGGTISLVDGAQVEMRRSLKGRWKLQTTDNRQALVEIWRDRAARQMALTIRSFPVGITQASVVILTACAVLMLESMMPRPSSVSAGA